MEKIRFTPILSPPITVKGKTDNPASTSSFADKFKDALHQGDLKISKHANDRLIQRNIDISEAQWQKVGDKVREAKSKGVQDSLVLLKDAALIVSVKNHTVITAIDIADAKDQIFTNIDGMIFVQE
ncbi:TIGR02530 family flagellar biosynthesis protein [Jeotgalibacillus soli]|uniref:Flagellar protein n=1 Tax=Jeotgalibacillus soli TaxID=889306 RepID=A0A0C2VK93_9BACL|nr:TIGR02530 family flagellar biosynthesis protein [Jeotgalibacillus soli]KIL44891.1 hypothetical protein KP78_24350 [Jeotgalibacillus soli]